MLTWTTEKPTTTGRYWYKDVEGAEDWESCSWNAVVEVCFHQSGGGGVHEDYYYALMPR